MIEFVGTFTGFISLVLFYVVLYGILGIIAAPTWMWTAYTAHCICSIFSAICKAATELE